MYNLLDDALIAVRRSNGPSRVDLPGLIAGLLNGSVLECTSLRAHQAEPWHVFLVQLAASVMARHPELTEPPRDPVFWRDQLLALAHGERSAWELLVDDVTKPAFLQHPLPDEAALAAFKPTSPKARAPDELDVLVIAENHDVKTSRMRPDDPQAWTFALVSYQTTSGYLGARNYGSIRMNTGSGSRSIVSFVSSPVAPARFSEELDVIRDMRADAIAGGLGYVDRGVVLTWMSAWDRRISQFAINELEPWFIEAVRPVRLVQRHGGIVALGAGADARQIGPKTLDGGDVADPWTPINVANKKKGRSALTVVEGGWTADLIARLLFQRDIETTVLQRPRVAMNGTAWMVGSVLARGIGKTDGFHRFSVPVPASIRPKLLRSDQRDLLGKASTAFIADAKAAESAIRDALTAYAQGGREGVKSRNVTVSRWVRGASQSFVMLWSDEFLPSLWRLAEAPLDDVQAAWRAHLVALAREALESSFGSIPVPSARRWRAVVAAHRILEASLHKKGLLPQHPLDSREAA